MARPEIDLTWLRNVVEALSLTILAKSIETHDQQRDFELTERRERPVGARTAGRLAYAMVRDQTAYDPTKRRSSIDRGVHNRGQTWQADGQEGGSDVVSAMTHPMGDRRT